MEELRNDLLAHIDQLIDDETDGAKRSKLFRLRSYVEINFRDV